MKPDFFNTDRALIDSLLEGDKKAFDIVYEKFAPVLYRYTRKNVVSDDDAKEIVQDVFLYLWANHANLQIENLWGYLLKATRNDIAEYFRVSKVKARYQRHYKYFETVYDPYDYNPDAVFDPDLIQEVIERNLPVLPDKCQQVFRMRLSQNLSNAEIAEQMNIKKATVEHYMVQALNHLRSAYKTMQHATMLLLAMFFGFMRM